jgi:hypothetical protein
LTKNVSRHFSSDISSCSISEIAVTDWADIFRQDFWLSHTPRGRYFFRQKFDKINALKNGMAPHNIMAFVKHLLVVGCLCRFALRTQHGIRFGRAKEQ